jgi:hypothetical protein
MKPSPAEKFCPGCKATKPRGEFYRNRRDGDGARLEPRCKQCCYEKNKANYWSTGRERYLISRYGLDKQKWTALFESQKSRCACCGTSSPDATRGWHTDHDHKTGAVRGILCAGCNTAIGQSNENPSRLLSMVDYLRRHARAPAKAALCAMNGG